MPFPTNPSVGDTYVENDTTYEYLGPVNGWFRKEVGPNNDTTYIGSDGAPNGVSGDTQVVFNDSGTLAGDSGLTYNKTTNFLDVIGQVRASTGILFGGDTAAANALDDYEEGTFTITLLVAGTSGTAPNPNYSTAYYVKVGKLVSITATLRQAPSTPTGAVTLSGTLPFQPLRRTEFHIGSARALDITDGSVVVGTYNNSTTLQIYKLNDEIDYASLGGSVSTSDARTTKTLSFSGVYYTNS